MKLTGIAFRNIARNLRRSILSGAAIAVSAMSIVLLFSFIDGMREDMAGNLTKYYTGEIRIRNKDFAEYERYNPIHLSVDWQAIEPLVAKTEGLKAVFPRIPFPASLYLDGTNHGVMVIGADFTREPAFQNGETVVKEGRLPSVGQNEILMGVGLADNLGLAIGDKVTLISTTAARGSNAITVQITGLATFPVMAMNSTHAWMPLDRVQYFLRMGTAVQEVLIMASRTAKEELELATDLAKTIQQTTGVEVEVKTWRQLHDLYSLLEMAQYIYYFVGIFFFLLGSTVIINTTMMVIYERMREIGTLSALGMHGTELTRLFFLEGSMISAIGAAVGVLLGVGITLYFGRFGLDFTDALSGIDFEISSVLYPRISWLTAVFVYLYAVVISSLATFIPSRRASKIQPVEALGYV